MGKLATVVGTAVIVALLTSCTAPPQPSAEPPRPTPTVSGSTVSSSTVTVEYLAVGTSPTWQVSVLNPSSVPPQACAEDESVELSLMSADMPSSHVNYSLDADATEDDARRVAACMEASLTSGAITLSPPLAQ